MLENQSKKILLFSDDPADASFLSEIAVMHQAELVLVQSAADLCAKIAQHRAESSLAAIHVDVTTPALLRKFEYELQSKMGTSLAAELSSIIHFISGKPMALNREVLQSPYFSFYSERKPFDFTSSAKFYRQAFGHTAEFFSSEPLSFDPQSRDQCFERLKKELLSKGASAEWILKFKTVFEEMLELLFPARFECFIQFSNSTFKIAFTSSSLLSKEQFKIEKFLEYGVSAMISSKNLILFLPVFQEVSAVQAAFKFYKVET